MWEAELLRSPDPIVLGCSIRPPHVGDVIDELHRLLPVVRERRCRLVGWSGDGHDTVELMSQVRVGDDDHYLGEEGTRWAAPDTPRVYAVLRTQAPWTNAHAALVQSVPTGTGISMQYVYPNGDVFPFPPRFIRPTPGGAPGGS